MRGGGGRLLCSPVFQLCSRWRFVRDARRARVQWARRQGPGREYHFYTHSESIEGHGAEHNAAHRIVPGNLLLARCATCDRWSKEILSFRRGNRNRVCDRRYGNSSSPSQRHTEAIPWRRLDKMSPLGAVVVPSRGSVASSGPGSARTAIMTRKILERGANHATVVARRPLSGLMERPCTSPTAGAAMPRLPQRAGRLVARGGGGGGGLGGEGSTGARCSPSRAGALGPGAPSSPPPTLHARTRASHSPRRVGRGRVKGIASFAP